MKKNTLKTICLSGAALVLTVGLTVGSAMAYFTTYATSEGQVTLSLGFAQTEIEEKVVAGKKEIKLTNTGDQDCYVRLKALTGDVYKDSIIYSEQDGAGKWTPGGAVDGYYYYSDIVAAGQATTQIDISFAFPEGEDPAGFNVIIIQESTPVLYDENGNPYADWAGKVDVSQSVYKGEAEV